jgi:hypothetical protein
MVNEWDTWKLNDIIFIDADQGEGDPWIVQDKIVAIYDDIEYIPENLRHLLVAGDPGEGKHFRMNAFAGRDEGRVDWEGIFNDDNISSGSALYGVGWRRLSVLSGISFREGDGGRKRNRKKRTKRRTRGKKRGRSKRKSRRRKKSRKRRKRIGGDRKRRVFP